MFISEEAGCARTMDCSSHLQEECLLKNAAIAIGMVNTNAKFSVRTHASSAKKGGRGGGGGTSQAAFDASQAAAATDAEVAQAQKLKAYSATPSGSEMKAWLLFKGIDEDDVGRILINFIKPEYEITTLLEMFALENQDIAEVLQGLPLGKRKVLKMLVKQERDGI